MFSYLSLVSVVYGIVPTTATSSPTTNATTTTTDITDQYRRDDLTTVNGVLYWNSSVQLFVDDDRSTSDYYNALGPRCSETGFACATIENWLLHDDEKVHQIIEQHCKAYGFTEPVVFSASYITSERSIPFTSTAARCSDGKVMDKIWTAPEGFSISGLTNASNYNNTVGEVFAYDALNDILTTVVPVELDERVIQRVMQPDSTEHFLVYADEATEYEVKWTPVNNPEVASFQVVATFSDAMETNDHVQDSLTTLQTCEVQGNDATSCTLVLPGDIKREAFMAYNNICVYPLDKDGNAISAGTCAMDQYDDTRQALIYVGHPCNYYNDTSEDHELSCGPIARCALLQPFLKHGEEKSKFPSTAGVCVYTHTIESECFVDADCTNSLFLVPGVGSNEACVNHICVDLAYYDWSIWVNGIVPILITAIVISASCMFVCMCISAVFKISRNRSPSAPISAQSGNVGQFSYVKTSDAVSPGTDSLYSDSKRSHSSSDDDVSVVSTALTTPYVQQGSSVSFIAQAPVMVVPQSAPVSLEKKKSLIDMERQESMLDAVSEEE